MGGLIKTYWRGEDVRIRSPGDAQPRRFPENLGTDRIRDIVQKERKQAKSGQQVLVWLACKVEVAL